MLTDGRKLTGYPSIDKPWLKYYTEQDLQIEVPKCTIYQNIYDRNKEYPKAIAINYFGNKISYAALFDRTEQCAKALIKVGIRPGDCVTLCTAGIPEAIYVVLACSRIGAIANFINPLFTKEQTIDRINETEARWIFILDEMYSYIKNSLSETCIQNVVIIPAANSAPVIASKVLYLKSKAREILASNKHGTQKYQSWKEFVSLGCAYNGNIDVPYEPDTPAVMVYSSGSTGASKGILLTNDGVNAMIANYGVDSMFFDRSDTFLAMIPIWFSTGAVYSILMPLAKGFTVIPEPVFSKESFLKDLIKYKPSITLTATSLWIHIVNSDVIIDLSNMKYPITGGEKILPQDEQRINAFLYKNGCKKKFYKGYGMCELGSEITGTTDAPNYSDKPGGAGYPILNVNVAAFNIDTDEELKYGEHGEIRVCSPARMKGYFKNPEATAKFFKTDAKGNVWGCTGDIGYVDEEGEVFILGRATDCYHRENGETVYLFDIEDEIFKDESVNQCKVVDFEEDDKTKLAAHIVFREGTVDEEDKLREIHDRLSNKLPDYMQPDYYKIREAMPVHSNGKRDVEALRADRDELMELA